MLRGLPIALLLFVVAWVPLPANQGAQTSSDAAFIQSLSDADEQPVDRRRLARLFFSLASTLEGDKQSVRFLQARLSPRDATREPVRRMVGAQYGRYADAVAGFKASVSDLLDSPESPLQLYRVLIDGQRACWYLDGYSRVVETYGVSAPDLMSILASTEGCASFRQVAFQPRVEGIVHDALIDRHSEWQEIRELREELRELEQLLEDLTEIDESP